jgi:hypothetical protein
MSRLPSFSTEYDITAMQASFICPSCGNKNTHGTLGGFGHRVSHCKCWPDGYVILEPGRDYPEDNK